MRLVVLVLAALVAACAPKAAPKSQQPAPRRELTLEEICAKVPCRAGGPFRMRIDAERVWEGDLPGAPWVFDELANVLLGETLHVAGDLQADRTITNLRKADAPGRNVVTFRFEEFDGKPGEALLVVSHGFEKPFRYRAAYFDHNAGRPPRRTSTCAVQPKMSTYEHWPHPIVRLVLTDFRLVEPTDRLVCD